MSKKRTSSPVYLDLLTLRRLHRAWDLTRLAASDIARYAEHEDLIFDIPEFLDALELAEAAEEKLMLCESTLQAAYDKTLR